MIKWKLLLELSSWTEQVCSGRLLRKSNIYNPRSAPPNCVWQSNPISIEAFIHSFIPSESSYSLLRYTCSPTPYNYLKRAQGKRIKRQKKVCWEKTVNNLQGRGVFNAATLTFKTTPWIGCSRVCLSVLHKHVNVRF